MQDFNYLASNSFELTLELGCRKFPPGKDLPGLWNENKDALINFMWQVGMRFIFNKMILCLFFRLIWVLKV